MLKKRTTRIAAFAAGLSAALTTGGALALPDSHTYTFDFENTSGTRLTGDNDRMRFVGKNHLNQTKTVTVSAWRIENLRHDPQYPVSIGDIHGDASAYANSEVSEYIYEYSSGLGVRQVDSSRSAAEVDQGPFDRLSYENQPWHGVDNNPSNCSAPTYNNGSDNGCDAGGRQEASYTGEEFLVFDFGESHEVNLHSFEWGYAREGHNSHADSTVLSGKGVSSLDDLKTNRVTNAGFDLVNHYGNVGQGVSQRVETNTYARFWAVSTLLFSEYTGHWDPHLFDAGKLASIVVKTSKIVPPPPGDVPVPATLFLFGAGLLFLRGPLARKSRVSYPRSVTA